MIGVIDLPSFYGSSGNGPKATDDVEELIEALKTLNAEGLILDLRRNGGGYLSEAVNLACLFPEALLFRSPMAKFAKNLISIPSSLGTGL